MEEQHCREELHRYDPGQADYELYAASLADVAELRKRLPLYDAADSLLAALTQCLAYLDGDLGVEYRSAARHDARAAIANAEGRSE